jgi:hypothetical protein
MPSGRSHSAWNCERPAAPIPTPIHALAPILDSVGSISCATHSTHSPRAAHHGIASGPRDAAPRCTACRAWAGFGVEVHTALALWKAPLPVFVVAFNSDAAVTLYDPTTLGNRGSSFLAHDGAIDRTNCVTGSRCNLLPRPATVPVIDRLLAGCHCSSTARQTASSRPLDSTHSAMTASMPQSFPRPRYVSSGPLHVPRLPPAPRDRSPRPACEARELHRQQRPARVRLLREIHSASIPHQVAPAEDGNLHLNDA